LTSKRTGLVIVLLAAAAGLVFVLALMRAPSGLRDASASVPGDPAPPAGDVTTLTSSPHLLFRHTTIDANYNRLSVAALAEPNGPRGVTALECERVAFAAGKGICLKANRGLFTTYEAIIFDSRFQPVHSLKLEGSPSRTRISPDGRYGAITVFVSGAGHSYVSLTSLFTKTILLDMATGTILGDLEQFTTSREGQRFTAADFNFWGVTFARDSSTFYATLLSANRTYLVRGDVAARTLTVLRENVECPSISPDNRLLAYKKRVGGGVAPWRFHVLDLNTMSEKAIAAETRSIDDQIEWFDNAHVLYGAVRSSQSPVLDVWIAPVDGKEPARPFLRLADSPVLVR
jgi:hypothetical protein